ncbi:MAG TPA: Uma2 family endonuclease [Thermoanaerobaculia bacterium]
MENPSSPVRLTYADLCRLPDDGLRHELIDGEHYMTPAPTHGHQQVAMNVAGHLFMYLRERRRGRVYMAPLDVLFSDADVVEPDVLYVSKKRLRAQQDERCLTVVPDLVVEVLSPSTRRVDRGAKRSLYERQGVTEYWLIDPVLETVQVFRLKRGRFELAADLIRQRGDAAASLSTPLLPGFRILLDDVFD